MCVVFYLISRPSQMKGAQKLTDSEITSITWAMHRQRRHHEENNKSAVNAETDDRLGHGVKCTVGGTVNNRISKRHSIQSSADGDKKIDSPRGQTGALYPNQDQQYLQRRYDSRQDWSMSRYRTNRESDGPYIIHTQTEHTAADPTCSPSGNYHNGPLAYKYSGHFQSGFTMKPSNRNRYQVRDNRLKSVSELDDDTSYETNVTKLDHEHNSVQFYNGTSAYFSQNTISEPVYL